jgi:DNA-binding CsgD family transcriptional regulator
MVLTRREKEELVKQLYEEGKTIREIAKAVHMSFTDISAIIKKVTGDSSKDSSNKPVVSRETKALRLFSNGNSSVEVAIKLDIRIEEAEELYLGFWRLKQQPYLAFVYKELGSQFSSFIKLFSLLRGARITVKESVNLINDAKQLPILRNTFLDLTYEITNLTAQRKTLLDKVSSLGNQITIHENYLQIGQEELKRINFKIMEKSRELQYLDRLINDKTNEYTRYK